MFPRAFGPFLHCFSCLLWGPVSPETLLPMVSQKLHILSSMLSSVGVLFRQTVPARTEFVLKLGDEISHSHLYLQQSKQ